MPSVGPYKGTNLTVEQSKSQIRKILTKYGISQMRWTEDLDNDQVMFEFFMTGESRRFQRTIVAVIDPLLRSNSRTGNFSDSRNTVNIP